MEENTLYNEERIRRKEMYDYTRRFKGTNDITENDIPILRELDLLDNCSVVVFGITYKIFKKTNNKTTIEPNNDIQVDKKTLKKYKKFVKDDMKERTKLKRYMDKTSKGGK